MSNQSRHSPLLTCHSASVAQLTPPGRAAVAVLGVFGLEALTVVERHFVSASGRALSELPAERIAFGRWLSESGEEIVVCRHDAERVEIHCHGGTWAARQILDTLANAGCREATWHEWLAQQTPDPLETEALEALAGALTHRTAAVLLDQYRGALREAVRTIRTQIESNESGKDDGKTALGLIDRLLAREDLGRHLTRPWHVLVAGRPNVGKSSLVNAVLGYHRAIVFDQPGTTRDVLSATTAVDGWPVRLSDTAGLHATADSLERQGIELVREQLPATDLIIWVLDATQVAGSSDTLEEIAREEMVAELHKWSSRLPVLIVLNKIDLAPAPDKVAEGVLPTCAMTGEGVPRLLTELANRLVPTPPAAGAAVPFTDRQFDTLRTAKEALECGDTVPAINALDKL